MWDPLATHRPQTRIMQKFRSPWSLALTALGVVLIAIGIGGLVARPMVGSAFASTMAFGGPPWVGGGWHAGGAGLDKALPPELAGLAEVPADQRFAHFRGVQVQLTDKDNRPVRVDIAPGTVMSVSATSLTIAGNDGVNHTYAVDDKTVQHGQAAKQGEHVVVASLNGGATAAAVFGINGDGYPGPRGPWSH
jgi:hypothetical protein